MKPKKKQSCRIVSACTKAKRSWSRRDFPDYTAYTITHANGKKSGFDVTAPGWVDYRVKVAYGLTVMQTVKVV